MCYSWCMSIPNQSADATRTLEAAHLDDELARIGSEVHSLAIRHGITHAASIDTASLIRALGSMSRRRGEDARVLSMLRTTPAAAAFVATVQEGPKDDGHARQVAAVRASLMLADTTADRHGVYARRPKAA